MAGDAYGFSPHGNGAHQWQAVINESWPTTDRHQWTRPAEPLPVAVRIVWERDGEQQLEAMATRWSGQHVYVEFTDTRLRMTGAWVDAADVRRIERES